MRTSYKSDSIVQPSNFPKIPQQQYMQKTTSKQQIQMSPAMQNIDANHQIKVNKQNSSSTNPAALYQIQSPNQLKQNPIQYAQYLSLASPQQFKQPPLTQLPATTKQQYFSSPQQFQTERGVRIQTQPHQQQQQQGRNQVKNEQIIYLDQTSPIRQNLQTQNSEQYYNQNLSNQKANISGQVINTTMSNYSPVKVQQQQVQQLLQQQLIQNAGASLKQSPQTKTQLTNQLQNKNGMQIQQQQQQQLISQKILTSQQSESTSPPKQHSQTQQESEAKINLMDQKMNLLVQEINSLQVLVVKKNKEAKYWKQKYETIDQNMASFLSDDDRAVSQPKKQKNTNPDSVIEEERDIDNSEEYQKRDSLINKLKYKIKDIEQQLFDKDIYYKEQLDAITKIIKQKDDYLQQYIQLNQELLDKIEGLSQQQAQFQQMKEDNEQLFMDLQNKQETIDKLQKQLNIDDRTSLYNSRSKNGEDDFFKDNLIDKLNCEIQIMQSDQYILQSQLKSLQAENTNLQARVNSLLFSQSKGSMISQESPSIADRYSSARESEMKKIQQQISHYATLVQEIQNDEQLKDSNIILNDSNKQQLINEIQSTYRDSSRSQSILTSDFVTERKYDSTNIQKKFISSNANSPSNDPILHQDSI